MGNEASMEGEAQAGQAGPAVPSAGAPASISAPADSGQLTKPSNGAPAGGSGAAPGPGINRAPSSAAIQSDHQGTGDRLASHGTTEQKSRMSLQVDTAGSRTGRSPSVSPHSSAPSSPYSVPQIAPMPSSKLCPVCKTTDLMGNGDSKPAANTCTQCRSLVCSQCGFNPNPHLTEVQEWLCLNCQMQRALGMDMTTPRSKSQQQLHSPSAKTDVPAHPAPQPQPPSQTQSQPAPKPQQQQQQQQIRPPTSMAKAPSQPDLSRNSPAHQPHAPRQDQTRSAGSSPSRQPPPPEQTFGKLFGFGASLLNSASNLISETIETIEPQQPQPPKPAPKPSASTGALAGKAPGPQQAPRGPSQQKQQQQQQKPPPSEPKAKVCCPLCKTTLNVGSTAEAPNYNTCTQCHAQVCNMCGFNPMPHLVEKKEWLCLNCQTQRALSGGLGDIPTPVPQPPGSPRHPVPASQHSPAQQSSNQAAGLRPTGPHQQKASGHQVSAPQTKGPSQPSPQSKPTPQPKPSPQPPAQTKGTAPPSAQSKATGQAKSQPVSQVKGPGPAKGQAKAPAQPSGAKAAPASGKAAPQTKTATAPTKTTPAPSKTTGTNQARKPSQGQEKTKTSSKPTKEDVKTPPKKTVAEPVTSPKDTKIDEDTQMSRHQDYTKSSTQSLSDTGYSSDGISGSLGEITGQIHEEGIKLNASVPSDITKLESSMKPLLEPELKNRPHSLSVGDYSPEDDAARDESEDDLSCKLRHDYVEDSSESGLSPLPIRQKKSHKDLTDEEYMRRQIMEMSADEDEMEEYGAQKTKRTHKSSGDQGKERRRLSHQSNSFEDDPKAAEARTEEDGLLAQGGLRRFKTIELNNTNSYNRDIELSTEHDLREPELEMESLTGTPEERSKGDYSSTLPATTPSYTSGTSPTSVSSMEDDSDSSPSRRARLEEAKQQRKARHRSHGPLLPTIEDSSEEDELREEEELLREQEQMRDLEQQRIRSTARKAKRDKEELRAQRRRERSKTPPSNLSPIEDASPTEELRQAAEMEELHRSSCSEYSPSMDSEAEGFEGIGGKLYKSGNEYNLPTLTTLYSPTEKTSAVSPSDKTLKSAEEVYEEMMRKAQIMQRQGHTVQQKATESKSTLEPGGALTPGSSPTQIAAPVSFSSTDPRIPAAQHLSKETQNRMMTQSAKIEGVVGLSTTKAQPATTRQSGSQRPTQTSPEPASSSITSKVFSLFKGPSPPVSPTTSPAQSPTHAPAVRPSSGRQLPSVPGGPTAASTQSPQRAMSPRLSRQSSSQESPVMVITLASETTSPAKPQTVNSSTSPLSSPTQANYKTLYSTHVPPTSSPKHSVNVGISTVNARESTSMEIISNVPCSSSTNVVDLRAPMRSAPIIMTDQGMDLTSLASDTRRYSGGGDQASGRHTAVQPLIMNLNSQEQPHVSVSTPTTVSVTVAGVVYMSPAKTPVIYGDPLQNRVDLGQCVGSAVCLTQSKTPITDPSIPKIDACLENLGLQQQQLQLQQQKLLQQQQILEEQLQQHQQQTSFARYNLANQVTPVIMKKDLVVSQTSSAQSLVTASAISRPIVPHSVSGAITSAPQDSYGGVALELKNKPTAVNLSTGKPHVMMVQLDESSTSQSNAVTQLVKVEELPPQVLDLTGQLKPENQAACCDVVYKLPFASSCSGSFGQNTTDKNPTSEASPAPNPAPPHLSAGQQQQQVQMSKGMTNEHKIYHPPILAMGRIQPSMSDTNLPSMTDGSQYQGRVVPGGAAVDLSGINQAYDSGYIGMGAQYGSYTDLRQDYSSSSLPLRRYGSLSNISSDYNYSAQNLSGSQDSNLAQYSATTAREISRMCAALNTADHMGRYRPSMELVPYGAGRGGSLGRLNLQQSLASIRASLIYGPDGRPTPNSQALTNLINARQASLRAMYPGTIRGGDGMIYSTINTPIASTLPITTQPASVIRPISGGVNRVYPTGVTAVPLASLTRLPQVTPRMPHPPQGQYYNNQYPSSATPALPGTIPQETPMYLGKPQATNTAQTNAMVVATPPTAHVGAHTVSASALVPIDQEAAHLTSATSPSIAQGSLQPVQTEPLSLTQALVPVTNQQSNLNEATSTKLSPPAEIPKGKEDEKMSQQQEHILQLERERVELEKLRQLRLHEELERDRVELQRHREKEQLLVQREIQELQTIKQQVLQQQQAERETQLIMQREQLAQQRMQLEQIQSLQQQLQQQLEEQKRQKTAAVEAAAAAAAAEAAAASAAAAAAATSAQGALQGSPHGFIICDHTGRVIQQEGQGVQFWQDGQVVQAMVAARPIQSSASEMSLRSSDKQIDPKIMRKQNSMPRLRDGTEEDSVKKITDSCVQTDDEEGEDRFMNRRRRTRRIADCSVQTDEEDQGEWDQQPVRRRRSRASKHSESSGESKSDGLSKVSSSIAIQTTNDSSCQTEAEQLGRVSPAIHITMAETSKVDLLHYIAAPERTRKGESLACQTEPESQSQGVVAPQLSVPTTISPYSTSLHIVGANTADAASPRLQGVASFERRKPDPLDISYQQHDSRQPPKSPQVLYSPVSPLSPHRMLETTFASQEKLNKAHVTPQQKAFTAESPQRHQSLPRPIKSVQRSMSDPKPLSPTSEDPAKNRFSPYHQQALSNSQMATLQQQQNSLMRKVKRTLPSPPPEEIPLPIVTPAQMYSSPGMSQRILPRSVQGVTKAGLLNELKAVEQESSKLRKQQAELEEEEKEIDAKLRCLELGITQRKETMVKERERRELAYLRCMGDARDYMSDSELNNLRMAAATGTFDANGLLTRPSTAPLSQFTNDPNATSQYPSTSSYMSYPYPQSQSSVQPPASAYGFQTPYPTSAPQPGTFQPHPPTGPLYPNQTSYSTRSYGQSSYQTDLGMQQHSHQGFHPSGQPMPSQSLPYPSSSYQPGLPYQQQADILTVHQRPRQTSLADLEQKLPTNYEVISNPAVSVATSAPDTTYGSAYSNAYGQYRPPEPGLTHSNDGAMAYGTDGMYTSNLEQNIPRNYVMIDDISELTKDNTGQTTDALGHPVGGRYRNENGPIHGSSYGRPEEETLDAYGRPTGTAGYQTTADSRTSTTVSGSSSYYYDDYKHGARSSSGSHKSTPKNLTPGFSSKRSKHRKQGMEQKISKFSPIEEARDVESDLASYTMTTSTGGSCTVVTRSKKGQEDATYGKRHSYDQQKYYGTSREGLEEDDHMYTSGRSRSTGYGMDKISCRDSTGHRSKSYERDAMERSQRGSRSGRPPIRNQNSEEESPLSPVGKPVGIGRSSAAADAYDARNQYGSSHSLPDVQDHHKKDLPRSHVYKPDDPYLVDDMHCAVSDSEAYHLGQEETDWFEKPREARSKHHGSSGHSSTGRRSKHTYHDYDEPPEEYVPDEYNQQRHASSREHRHHGSSSGRHSSRHSSEDPRSSRSSRTHPKDPAARAEGRTSSGVQRRAHPDSRTAQGSPRNSGDFSRDSPTGHHHGRSQRTQGERPSSRKQEPNVPGPKDQHLQPQQAAPGQQRTGGQGPAGRHPGPESMDGAQQPPQSTQQQQPPVQQGPTSTTAGPGAAQQPKLPPTQGKQPGVGSAIGPPAPTATKMDATPPPSGIGSKAMMGPPAPQPSKAATPPMTGIGSKAAPVGIGSKPGGIGSAAAGQAPADGENVLSKILPGGAAEQAGKLGDALSGLGKKFTSFW